MKLSRGFQQIPELSRGAIATIGNFDGVHQGHQALLHTLRSQALHLGLPMVVMLFEPQPSEYFRGQQAPARLSSLREKLQMLKQCGVDYVFCLKFDQHLASMPALAFAERFIFSQLQAKYLLIGKDFRFGRERQGDIALLQQLAVAHACEVQSFPDFFIDDKRVSSTNVRHALDLGELEEASKLLGRAYSICGRVVYGDGRGRQWGFPTANVNLHRLTLPLKGVFCVQVKRLGKPDLVGVANIGCRPTLDGQKNVLEIHLFDFDESLYGEMLEVFFTHKLRDEKKFPSVDVLIAQIRSDVETAKAYYLRPLIMT